MVCVLSGLPGTIQLARHCVVTVWFMLRSLICSLCLYNPSAPATSLSSSPSLFLFLSGLPALTVHLNAKKAEATSRLRLFLSVLLWRATGHILCCGGKKRQTKKKQPCCQGVVGRDSRVKCDGNGEALHLYNIVCERCWQATVWEGQSIRSQDGSVSQPSALANPELCWLTDGKLSANGRSLVLNTTQRLFGTIALPEHESVFTSGLTQKWEATICRLKCGQDLKWSSIWRYSSI